MPVKELKKPSQKHLINSQETKVQKFILQGGTSPEPQISEKINLAKDHRLTLRIPKILMDKIDIKRKNRVGKISRNLWILELIEKATRN